MNPSALVLSDREQEIERCHQALGQRWDLTTSASSVDAAALLGKENFSMLLVSDSIKSDDFDLFEKEVQRTLPGTPVVQFEPQKANKGIAFRSPQGAWQLTPKHLDAESVADQLARRLLKEKLRADDGLRRLVPEIKTLPSWRDVYHKVVREINSPNGSLATVAELVEDDPVLTARILKTANSAAFGFRRRISDPAQAVMLLGGERLKSILLFTVVLSVSEHNQCQGFNPDRFWAKSVRSAELARKIMKSGSRNQTMIDAAFTAGLVHDIGRLLMAVNIPELYTKVVTATEGIEEHIQEEEYKLLETSHTELGAYILESWDLPYPILEAVYYHHTPDRAPVKDLTPLSAVVVADAIARERVDNPEREPALETPSFRKAKELFGNERIEAWFPEDREEL